MPRKPGTHCLGIIILTTWYISLEYAFPSFVAQAVCRWNYVCLPLKAEEWWGRWKLVGAAPLTSPSWVSSVPSFLRRLASVATPIATRCVCLCFVRVVYALCLFPPPSPVPALYFREPSLEMLAVSLGSLVRELWASLCCSACHILLLVLYLVWGFWFPGPAGGLEYARMSLHCSLNPEWVFTQRLCQWWFLTALQSLHSFLFRWTFSLLGNFSLMQDYLSVAYNINTNTYKYQCSIWCGTSMDLCVTFCFWNERQILGRSSTQLQSNHEYQSLVGAQVSWW